MLTITDPQWQKRALILIVGLYVPFILILSASTGYLSRVGESAVFFGSTDSQGYKLVANYYTSFGKTEWPGDYLVILRPFLFPLFLSLYQVVGITGVQTLQILMTIASLWLTCIAIKAISQRTWLAVLGTLVLALTPTLNLIVFHGLTESLSLFLISVFIVLLVSHYQQDHVTPLYYANWTMSLLLCVKPIMLPFWILALGYSLAYTYRQATGTIWRPVVTATPVLAQVLLAYALTGVLTLSPSGRINVAEWYFPVVYGMKEYGRHIGNKSAEAKAGIAKYPEFGDRVQYIVSNPAAAVRAYFYTLVYSNLIAGSNFVGWAGNAADPQLARLIYLWSVYLNRLVLCLHLGMVLVCIWLALKGIGWYRNIPLVGCYLFALTLILPLGFPYFQGDRYVVLVHPLWLVAHAALAGLFLDVVRLRQSESTGTMASTARQPQR